MANVNSIDTKEAMILFEAGSLIKAVAVPVPLSIDGSYQLLLYVKNKLDPYVLAAQRDPVRRFKSADGVIATAKKIGFKDISFNFPHY